MFKKIMNFFRLTKLSLSTINLSITNSIPVKKYSLGAVYRIKNAESTIELAIRSIIDILDEVVIVDNASSDNTKKIILKLKSEYGEKIKIFQYENELCRAGVGYQECLKKNKDGSLAD
ncbi:glycosyltransferase, partial [Escherichia coli]